jgi:site-specific recombinase XerD
VTRRADITVTRYVGKRRTTYGFRFWSRGRLVQAKGFRTEGLAKEAGRRERRRVEEAAFEARWGPLTPRLTRWAEAKERYRTVKEGRKRSLKDDLTRLDWWITFFEGQRVAYLQAVTPDEVDRGRAALEQKDLSAQTVKHYLAVLRHLFELARRRWNVVRANPVLQVEIPTVKRRVRRVPDAAARQKLLDVAEPHMRRLIIAAMYTGLREGAIMRLSAERFTERPGWLRATDEKGSKEYWIPVAAPLVEMVRSLGITSGPLWRKPGGSVMQRFPRKSWERARAAARLPDLRFHDLRRLVGTVLHEAGMPLRAVQAFLGHAKATTTEIYTDPTDPALLEAARILERTFGPATGGKDEES